MCGTRARTHMRETRSVSPVSRGIAGVINVDSEHGGCTKFSRFDLLGRNAHLKERSPAARSAWWRMKPRGGELILLQRCTRNREVSAT